MLLNIRVFVVISILAILLGIPAGIASAAPLATCNGNTCNNLDPQTSGCTAVTANMKQKDGTSGSGTLEVELRWSSGCNANWSRATNIYPGVIRSLRAQLTDNTTSYHDLVLPFASSSYGQIWTNMYNGTGTLCAIGNQGLVGGKSYDTVTPPACG